MRIRNCRLQCLGAGWAALHRPVAQQDEGKRLERAEQAHGEKYQSTSHSAQQRRADQQKTFNSLVSFDDMDEASSIGAVESGVQVWCTSSNSSSQIASDVLCESIRPRVLQLYLRGNHFGGATEKRPPSFVAALVVLKPAVLDVSNCDLGAEGLAALAVALLPCVESGTLRSLAVGVNVKAGKSAARAGVAIAALLDHELEQSKLRSLNIEGQEDPPFSARSSLRWQATQHCRSS